MAADPAQYANTLSHRICISSLKSTMDLRRRLLVLDDRAEKLHHEIDTAHEKPEIRFR